MQNRILHRALIGNAAFSVVSAVALIALAAPLSAAFEVPVWLLVVIGAGLVPFAVLVRRTARDPQPSMVRSIIGADVAWVAAAAVVLAAFGASMAPAAFVALAIVTVAVADFAILQWVGLRRMAADAR